MEPFNWDPDGSYIEPQPSSKVSKRRVVGKAEFAKGCEAIGYEGWLVLGFRGLGLKGGFQYKGLNIYNRLLGDFVDTERRSRRDCIATR